MFDSAESLLIFTAVGAFLLFCIVMGFGGHAMPTSHLAREPTRFGDITLSLIAVAIIGGLVYFTFAGWRHIWAPETLPPPDPPLFAMAAQDGNLSYIGTLSAQALQKPLPLKNALQDFCKSEIKLLSKAQQALVKPCQVFLWAEPRLTPRAFPIPPSYLPYMTANYAHHPKTGQSRFCWLQQGRVDEKYCF